MTRVDTRTQNPRPVVIKILLIALALFAMFVFGWADVLIEHLGKAAALAVATLVGGVLLFLWNIPRAAEAIQKEADDEIKALREQLDDKHARQAAMDELWRLRKDGVELRNTPVASEGTLPLWNNSANAWCARVYGESEKANPNLRGYLETLNEVGDPPSDLAVVNNAHLRMLQVMSEILRRLEAYLARELR